MRDGAHQNDRLHARLRHVIADLEEYAHAEHGRQRRLHERHTEQLERVLHARGRRDAAASLDTLHSDRHAEWDRPAAALVGVHRRIAVSDVRAVVD